MFVEIQTNRDPSTTLVHFLAAGDGARACHGGTVNVPTPPENTLRRALVAAACWWVPLVLILIGLTLEGVALAPGTLRLAVALAAGVMLALGFLLVSTRRRTGSDPARGLWRLDTAMMWVVSVSVAVYALSARSDQSPTVAPHRSMVAREIANARKVSLTVEGMTCQGCVQTVTEALLRVPGVVGAVVSLDSASAVVSVDPGQAPGDTALVNAVVRAGYGARPLKPEGD
jgi:copper chaperone CopZ